jgi:3'-phosphoadenosine 5'-phosphosulfate sulfotransferase (PAPS reductase)/FAD synthetase
MSNQKLRVVSVSGGKDSTATLLLALETNWQDDVRAVFADTDNEHEAVYEYLDYLERETGVTITRVKADFTKQMATKRINLQRIANGEPESAVYGKRQFSALWTPERAQRAAELMEPTGNAYLDMCLVKGGFPSRKRQYCTENLKSIPCDKYVFSLLEAGHHVEQWHGIRGDESPRRAAYPDYEWGPLISVRRPILRWDVNHVFEQHRKHGIKPNPLYTEGFKRVGCMPCINSGKADISRIARRAPEHIDKIREYEVLVAECSRNQIPATFFHINSIGGRQGVDQAVAWSKTTHGGKQYDLLGEAEDVTMCSSEYGLCE